MRLHYWLCAASLALTACGEEIPAPIYPTQYTYNERPSVATPPAAPKTPSYFMVPERCRSLIPLALESKNPSWALAQIDQESACNPYAVSPVGALGLAQFMPGTLKDAERGFCRSLGRAQPNNPEWAMRCRELYMEFFTVDEFPEANYCANLFVDSMRYNAGFWIIWELRASQDSTGAKSFLAANRMCTAGVRLPNGKRRSIKSCEENYEYPERIAFKQSWYEELGGTRCPYLQTWR